MNKGLFYGLVLLFIPVMLYACQEITLTTDNAERQGQSYNLSITCDTCVVNIHQVNGFITTDITDSVIGHEDFSFPICDTVYATINQWVSRYATYELTYQPSNTHCIGGTRGANIYLEYY